MILYNNKVSITVFDKLYVSMQTNKLSNNKNVLKNIQSNAQTRMVVQIYFIYERQNCLFVLIMHGTDRTGSNAQTSEYNYSDSSTQHIQAQLLQ